MPNSHERIGKHMEQEPADKFLSIYSHLLTLITVSTISVPEGDETFFDFHDMMVSNSNSVSIAAEVVEHFFWTIKRRFGIDNPIFFPELVD